MLEKSLKFIINNAKITLFATVFICIFISVFSFKLTVDASAESLLLEDDEDLKIYRELSSHFASEDFLILAYDSNDETFDKENLIKNEILAQELTKIDGVKSVLNITNAILLNSDDLSLQDKLAVLPNILSKDTNLSMAKKELLSHPFYTNNIISKDAKTTAFIIYLKKDTRYDELIKLRDEASNENEKESYFLLLLGYKRPKTASAIRSSSKIAMALSISYTFQFFSFFSARILATLFLFKRRGKRAMRLSISFSPALLMGMETQWEQDRHFLSALSPMRLNRLCLMQFFPSKTYFILPSSLFE